MEKLKEDSSSRTRLPPLAFQFECRYQKQGRKRKSNRSCNITGRALTQLINQEKGRYQYSQWNRNQFHNVEEKSADGAATCGWIAPHIAPDQPVVQTSQKAGNYPRD